MVDVSAQMSIAELLRIRSFRLFVGGQAISVTGTWMQRATQDWLVLTLTGSPASLAITITCQFLPYLLVGLWGGVGADRFSKRRVMVLTQTSMALLALILSLLTLSGVVTVWQINALAFLLGSVSALEDPSRESFAAELVGKPSLNVAIGINSAIFQISRVIGPPLAGLLLAFSDPGWIFLGNTFSYIAVVFVLIAIDPSELFATARNRRDKVSIRAGLRYAADRPQLLYPIILMGLISAVSFNYPLILASFSKFYYNAGPALYGALNAAFAIGCLSATFLVPRLQKRGGIFIVVGSGGAIGIAQILAAAMAFQLAGFVALIVAAGVVGQTFVIATNSWVQVNAGDQWRGRVMGLYMLVFMGTNALGT